MTAPGAAGYLEALKSGASDTIGFDKVINIVNHLSTDGGNKNTGHYNGLWKLLDDEREKRDVNFPLLKSVSAVHSTANAEFTAALLDAILCSWQALVKFSEEQDDTEGKKLLKLLTNKDNILLMCFVADLLFVLKVFQKKLQRDSLTIVDIEPEAGKFQKSVDKLSTSSLLGGWEEAFKEKFDEEENIFCGIELWEKKRRRPEANLYVTEINLVLQEINPFWQ